MQDKQHNAPAILAHMKEERTTPDHQIEEGEKQTIYVYEVAGGDGLYFTSTPVPEEHLIFDETTTGAQTNETVVDAASTPTQPLPATQTAQTPHRVLFFFLRSCAIVLFLLFLDSVSPILQSLFIPTVTVTLVPAVHALTLSSTVELGRLTDPITLSQSQTTKATGHGHQNATTASGTLVFYNGLFIPQTIPAGTTFTDSNGIAVVTDATVSIPAASPPSLGVATVPAHAAIAGSEGNIAAGDIDTTVNNGLLVKNTQFTGGIDERDYAIVRQSDITAAGAGLTQRVTASMTAALQGQRQNGDEIIEQPCQPQTSADHQAGDEAASVTVTVSLTCQAIVYNTSQLLTHATQELTQQVQKKYGTGYVLNVAPQITVTKAAASARTVTLSYLSSGQFVYAINTKANIESLKKTLSGKPRTTALAYLKHLSGIKQADISGVDDNATLPDVQHINILIVILGA